MREINESWSVLQDADRRRAYDAQRLATKPRSDPRARPPRSAAPVPIDDDDDDLVDVMPPMTAMTAGLFRHLPWVVLVLVLGGIFVMTAYAGSGAEEPPPAAPTAMVGDCLDVTSGPTTSIVSCAGPHEFEIVDRVVEPSSCPEGTEVRRLATDGRLDCIVAG